MRVAEVEFVDCSAEFLEDGGRSINTELMPDGRNPNEEGMRALASCLAVPFYTRSALGEASPNALGLNLFFTSQLPPMDSPANAPAPVPAVTQPMAAKPKEGSLGESLGLLSAEEREISCTAARCYKVRPSVRVSRTSCYRRVLCRLAILSLYVEPAAGVCLSAEYDDAAAFAPL